MARVEVVVAATSVESGRFDAVEKVVDGGGLPELFDRLAGVGQGYLEVRSAGGEFPLVTVGLRGGFAVVHCATATDQMALLRGDGSLAPQETVEVPIMDEIAIFTGEFALSVAAARAALTDFVCSGDSSTLGEWVDL